MGFDGIPPGTIRSPRGNSDTGSRLTAEQWCKGAPRDSPFHHWSNTQNKFCTICGVDYDKATA